MAFASSFDICEIECTIVSVLFFESEVGSVVVVVQSLVIQMKFRSSKDMENLGSSYEICEFESSNVHL